MLKSSYYNHYAEASDPGRFILFNKSWGSIAVVERETALAVQQGDVDALAPERADELAQSGFLVPADLDEISEAHKRWTRNRHSSALLSITIELTQACNLGCTYCYQNDYRNSNDAISDDMVAGVMRYINAVVTEGRRPITDVVMRFIGGEPLLQKPKVLQANAVVRAGAEGLGVRLHTQMDTNGVLLDEDIVRALDVLSVTISNREDHDTVRPRLGGQGSYDQIVGRLRRHAEHFNAYETTLSVRFNANAANARYMEDVYRMVKQLGIERTEFELYPTINYGFNKTVLTLSDQEFRKLFMKLVRLKFEHGETIYDFPRPTFAPCSAYTPYNLKVTATGKLALCDAMTAPVSSLNELLTDIDSYEDIFSRVVGYDPFEDDPCGTCTNVGICGGKYYCKTNVDAPDRDPCDFLNYELNEFLQFFTEAYPTAPERFDL